MNELNIESEINIFLLLYFFELENILNSNTTELELIKFQSEEANTDEFIKLFFQKVIKANNNIEKIKLETIRINRHNTIVNKTVNEIKKFKITNVFVPNELTDEQKKEIAASKKSIYTNPDLLLQIEDGKNIYYEPLELKSTKNNNIPGSSIQQVSPFEWVIFVKREKQKVAVSTGYYINSITEKLTFPDRSPRPQVGFNTLFEWNKNNRIIQGKNLTIIDNPIVIEQKIRLLQDWQDFLATEWLEIIKSEQVKNNEKWFNNTLRKFAIKFLEYTENIKPNEKLKLIAKLNSLIKD